MPGLKKRRKTIRLRSLLFCPANRPAMVAKLGRVGADAVAIDLEDAVPPDEKAGARKMAADGARSLLELNPTLQVFVRVNGFGTPWIEEDIALGLAAGIAGVILPKLERSEQLTWLVDALAAADRPDLGVIGGWETAEGIARVTGLLHDRLLGMYFGAEDYIADVGGERTTDNFEVAYARSRAVIAARVIGVPALDQAVVQVHDTERFSREAHQARQLGYQGKICLHPSQVPLAHRAFTPDDDEVRRSLHLLEEVHNATARGEGVIVVDGQMVDVPMVRRAEQLLARAGIDPEAR